jgi:hypothetical protein
VERHQAVLRRAGSPWQRLYFRPDPQGQGAFRAGRAVPAEAGDAASRTGPPGVSTVVVTGPDPPSTEGAE